MPGVSVAGSDGLSACVAVVDSQMQGRHTVAAGGVQTSITRSTSGTSVSIAVPGVGVACGDGLSSGSAVVDCQMQGGDAVATCGIQASITSSTS